MKVFVTVGTTKFDALIEVIFSLKVQEALISKNYHNAVIQYGKSQVLEENDAININNSKLKVDEIFSLKPSLLKDIEEADLIIGHAGAGTCLEVLEAGKPMIVVINESLMGNHQIELAERLAKDNHLVYCTPDTLAKTIEEFDEKSLIPYPKGDPSLFTNYLDNLMGF